jgi:hypothetical protein
VFEEFARIRNDIANLNQVVATFATSVSTLQNALSGIELRLTTAMSEQAETAAIALTTGLSNVESNLATAMNTQADAPSLGDISGAIKTALDERVGVEEHTEESTQLVIPATKLYAETKEIKQTFRKTIGVLRSVVTPIMLTLVEELAKDNPIPFAWHEVMLQAMLGDVVDRGEEVGLLQARAAWTKKEAGDAQLEERNTCAMILGTTHEANAFVFHAQNYVHLSQGQEEFELRYAAMSDTNPTSVRQSGQVDANTTALIAQMHEQTLKVLEECKRINEIVLLVYGAKRPFVTGVPAPARFASIPNPFPYEPGDSQYGEYESARGTCSGFSINVSTAMKMYISDNGFDRLMVIHYLSPGATSWFPLYG